MDAIALKNIHSTLVHLRFAGRSPDVPLAALDLHSRSTERHVREAAARYLVVDLDALRG